MLPRDGAKDTATPCARCSEPAVYVIWHHDLCMSCCRDWYAAPEFARYVSDEDSARRTAEWVAAPGRARAGAVPP